MELFHSGDGCLYYLKGNLWFRVMAIFADADNMVNDSNAYMEAREGASLLEVQYGVAIIAHKDDSGTTLNPMSR